MNNIIRQVTSRCSVYFALQYTASEIFKRNRINEIKYQNINIRNKVLLILSYFRDVILSLSML